MPELKSKQQSNPSLIWVNWPQASVNLLSQLGGIPWKAYVGSKELSNVVGEQYCGVLLAGGEFGKFGIKKRCKEFTHLSTLAV